MNARDELASIIQREYTRAVDRKRPSDAFTAPADAIVTAGYRRIFDGDCGLSNVKAPDDREAAEAWMRWSNLAMDDEIGAIGAMKRMLTELGYRKSQP